MVAQSLGLHQIRMDGASPSGSVSKELQEKQVRSLGLEDPLEECMATHSGILAWEIPWTEEPCRQLQSQTRLKRLGRHVHMDQKHLKTANALSLSLAT